ncbi:hypothetical protein PV325_011261, partial [Microctonus aethiopoides]
VDSDVLRTNDIACAPWRMRQVPTLGKYKTSMKKSLVNSGPWRDSSDTKNGRDK